MIPKIAFVAALAIGLPALAQQPKVSGGDTPPANPPPTQTAPADKASATPAPAASRSATAASARVQRWRSRRTRVVSSAVSAPRRAASITSGCAGR